MSGVKKWLNEEYIMSKKRKRWNLLVEVVITSLALTLFLYYLVMSTSSNDIADLLDSIKNNNTFGLWIIFFVLICVVVIFIKYCDHINYYKPKNK